jgi:hypothetical protein
MRVIALIDDPRVVEKILRHLGAWHDPPAGLSPPGTQEPYTREPFDEDPMPDYENALTDCVLPPERLVCKGGLVLPRGIFPAFAGAERDLLSLKPHPPPAQRYGTVKHRQKPAKLAY